MQKLRTVHDARTYLSARYAEAFSRSRSFPRKSRAASSAAGEAAGLGVALQVLAELDEHGEENASDHG